MRELYHYPLDPFGRLARIYLKEKSLDHTLIIELPWNRKKTFSGKHSFSDLPALIDMDGLILEGWYSIIEHLEQHYRSNSLLRVTPKEKAECRRIMLLFNTMFFADVTKNIVFEKVAKRHLDRSSPDSLSIRKSNAAIKGYFDYITWLTDRRNWLAGEEFTLVDISAAAHVSCIDYLGSIEWEKYPEVKDWYARVKSRPSFREILSDRIPNIAPPDYYQELDF
ncbi:MAG: glutathione S-transferase family protein [Holosporaceae bacterium]|jgi:glutathione S-transferase|nr:glutathione S-transferase family protein [Holosporaceae bacterium]